MMRAGRYGRINVVIQRRDKERLERQAKRNGWSVAAELSDLIRKNHEEAKRPNEQKPPP